MTKWLYIAYGSNLNLRQMAMRCPTAQLVGTGEVRDYELQFKGAPYGAFATICAKEGAAVLAVRVFLGAVFAGNFSTILYSAAGGVCAIGVTIALRKILTKKQLWVAGCLGAVAHSVGQMAMAIALTGTVSLAVYLPVMIVISILTGLFTGLCAQFLVNREKLWKIISK